MLGDFVKNPWQLDFGPPTILIGNGSAVHHNPGSIPAAIFSDALDGMFAETLAAPVGKFGKGQ